MINLSYIDEYIQDQDIPQIIINKSRNILLDFSIWYNSLDNIADFNRKSKNVYSSSILFSYLNTIMSSDNISYITIIKRSIKDTQFKMIIEGE